MTPAQRCEADVELASAKFAQCRLTAEAKYSKSLDDDKRASALARCSDKLEQSFAKAVARYGANCTNVPVSEFNAYLAQCSDDATAAAAGAATLTAKPRLLKTGQTTNYGAGTDGDLEFGIEHGFVDNGDGTLTDLSTGLMWEKKSDDGSIHDKDDTTYTWSGASYDTINVLDGTVTTFLAALNAGSGFAGHTDWRLPNRNELASLTDLQSRYPATFPAFNTNCHAGCTVTTCSCTVPSAYWSSSTYRIGDGLEEPSSPIAWIVYFYDGNDGANVKSDSLHVRAVRGGS